MTITTASASTARRKRKPKWLAVVNECCTGCGGAPVCQEFCTVDNCMVLVRDEEHAPEFGRMTVDPLLCLGCRRCISKGPDGIRLEGCPWDAIDLVSIETFEATYGELPY